MKKTILALGILLGALLLAFLASQPPAPRGLDAPAADFSAERAMADVRQIARAPHPTGSAESVRVQRYLAARMRELGMTVETQVSPLPADSVPRLRKWGDTNAAAAQVVNVIGILPGRDPRQPALLLMAHHDSVWGSPGAADDAAGVAASLEIVRAIRAQGQPLRDVVILATDAEEVGLDGAETFFGSNPLARRIGAVVNMEARGGGGRASMFETGRGNGAMMEVYRSAVARPSSNSLSVLVYDLMPNDTDFTIPKEMGLPGFNFAFIGEAWQYHSPLATPEALERGALQDLGAQALGVASALAFAPQLPGKSGDAVFSDVLGLFVIAYQPAVGWAVLAAAAALLAFAFVRARRAEAIGQSSLAAGFGAALALPVAAGLILYLGNLLSGSGANPNYYDRLAALPRLELQALCLGLAVLLLMASLRLKLWAGWFGLALIVLILATAAQVAAPTAGTVFAWPLLLFAIGAAGAAAIDPRLERAPALILIGIVAIIGAGHLLYLAHFTFLGVGAPMPHVLAVYAPLIALFVWPFLRRIESRRILAGGAALLLLAGAGLALSVLLDPIAESIPPYSERR